MPPLLTSPTKNGIQKTLASQLLSTATTADPITFDDVDGLPNLPGVLVIRRVDTSGVVTPSFREYIEYSGTSGNTVLITTRNVDGSNAALTHPVGSIVEFIPDITWADRVYDALANVVSVADLSVDLTKIVTPSGTQTLTNKSLLLGSSGNISSSGATISSIDADSSLTANSDKILATQKAVKSYVDAKAGSDGWAAAGETWVYASADDPTFTFTVAGVDLTTKYSAGMKIKLTQTTVKYFIITRVTFSTNTTITVYGGADYDLANAAITLPFYSTSRSPALFPLSRDKWMVRLTDTTDRSQGSPVASTIYNLGSLFISIPIGAWRVWYSICLQIDKTGVNGGFAGLSTGASSYSDLDLVSNVNASGAFTGNSLSKEKSISVTSKTSYFVVSSTSSSGVTTLYNRNNTTSGATLVVEAISEYI